MPDGATMQRPPQSVPQEPLSSKRDLASWWKQFKKNARNREEEKVPAATVPAAQTMGIFGVPLATSIRYANVAISLFDADGNSFIYGYVPIVVAKCGVFLKEKATEVEGIFRLAGAERRIKELQIAFNSPDRYGKGLDWTGYTVHDASNILRRYLNQLPEPIIPLEFYDRFREPLRYHQAQAVGVMEMQREVLGDFDHEGTIQTYQQLITELPALNRQLLLYILDLLAVFASKSDVNLMTAPNLSAIFQPGLLSHPSHYMAPPEYRLSQDVLIFLIENQDNFLFGMQGTAVDEKTIQDVQSGAPTPTRAPTGPAGRSPQLVARSASSASAGSESVRKYGGLRRNVSVNSKNSRQSNHSTGQGEGAAAVSPLTPTAKGSTVQRSNTVPSKKSGSPAVAPVERFSATKSTASPVIAATEPVEPSTPTPGAATTTTASYTTATALEEVTPPKPRERSPRRSPRLSAFGIRKGHSPAPVPELGEESRPEKVETDVPQASGTASPALTPSKERGLSSFFRTPPSTERDRSEGRKPNKLQKRRLPEELGATSNAQASQSSSHPPSPGLPLNVGSSSQNNIDVPPTENLSKPPLTTNQSFQTAHESVKSPPQSPSHAEPTDSVHAAALTTTPKASEPTTLETTSKESPPRPSEGTLKPGHSPTGSITSRSTGNELSAAENEEGEVDQRKKEKRHRRWKLSMSSKNNGEKTDNSTNLAATELGSSAGAGRSNSSVGSYNRPARGFSEDLSQLGTSPPAAVSSSDAEDRPAGENSSDKKGPLGWFRGKWHERKEKEAERERAKSPPPEPIKEEESAPEQSLNAVAAPEEPVKPPEQLITAHQPSTAPATAEAPATQPTTAPTKEISDDTAQLQDPEAQPISSTTDEPTTQSTSSTGA